MAAHPVGPKTGSQRTSVLCISFIFLIVIVLQWGVIFHLLTARQALLNSHETAHNEHEAPRAIKEAAAITQPPVVAAPLTTPSASERLEGVAVTLMFKAPRWFHVRYTLLVHNALANLPPNWKVQIFVNEPWFLSEVLPWHPGLARLINDPRVIVTKIPTEYLRLKPKNVMVNPWFWDAVSRG
jgi:hypothetical protein